MTASLAAERPLGHRLALDGLRGIAVLLVMAMHFGVPFLPGGGHTGVGIFFALSGFLITSLLLEEMSEGDRRVDLRGFYARRARRLLPALLFLVAVLVALDAARGEVGESLLQAAFAVFYVSNWVQAAGVPMDGLVHTWSLSVEEQFYLVWPAVLGMTVVVGGRRALVIGSVGIACLVLALRVSRPDLHIGIDRGDALMAGCALAAARIHLPRWSAVPAGAALAASAALPYTDLDVRIWGLVVVATASCVLIGSAIDSRALAWRPLVATGRLSYALYLWHVPVVLLLGPVLEPVTWPLRVLAFGGVSFAMAAISWRYVERPFLRRRRPARERAADEARPVLHGEASPAG
jgi:peptidoglycan/LPS O-acetylase OafA/YrhL